MTPASIAVLSLSMSADAFAASIARGAADRPNFRGAVRTGAVFGLIEMATPVIGWTLGLAAARFVEAVDHWIAFALLMAVGGKMAFEALTRPAEDEGSARTRGGWVSLVATAFATSMDAAAVGVTLAFLKANIVVIALSIGLATFSMTSMGMLIGKAAGARIGAAVEFVGGLALMALGALILAEHTGVIAWKIL